MDQAHRERVEANLFPEARAAVEPWESFPWHRGSDGRCDSHLAHSSQALAIDLFGTVRTAPDPVRNRVAGSIAGLLGLPTESPWTVELEWCDPENALQEPGQRTQVDALLTGSQAIVLVECKFTESGGGGCSQPMPRPSGARRGMRQCTGDYRRQVNPVNGIAARCALSGKGIRYWDFIPRVFDLPAGKDHRPCPFAGPHYQWMRNLVLARSIGDRLGRRPGFLLLYVDADDLPVARMVRDGRWAGFREAVDREAVAIGQSGCQTLLDSMLGGAADDPERRRWRDLQRWIEAKITRARSGHGRAVRTGSTGRDRGTSGWPPTVAPA